MNVPMQSMINNNIKEIQEKELYIFGAVRKVQLKHRIVKFDNSIWILIVKNTIKRKFVINGSYYYRIYIPNSLVIE